MRVLLFNGSPRQKGCTFTALGEVASVLKHEGIETEILQIGSNPVRDCIACHKCENEKPCVFDDDIVSDWLAKSKDADGFIIGTPVYYALRLVKFSLRSTGCFSPKVICLPLNPEPLLPLPEEAALRLLWTF
jgi:hypothetical protein